MTRFFPLEASQQEMYEELSLLVQSALDGYNVYVFLLMVKLGWGKLTLCWEETTRQWIKRNDTQCCGYNFKSIEQQNKMGWRYTLKVSFLEIYNEVIRDLDEMSFSLLCLSLVVQKLAQKSEHIPFRDSKWTHLLRLNLKGNSKTH